MGSRRTNTGVERVYMAADLWVKRALWLDDSLFTPGKPIWSRHWLAELRTRFLDGSEMSTDNFLDELNDNLTGSEPEVYQLAAESLYVHLLIASSMGGETKEDRINEVLSWSPARVKIPPGFGRWPLPRHCGSGALIFHDSSNPVCVPDRVHREVERARVG